MLLTDMMKALNLLSLVTALPELLEEELHTNQFTLFLILVLLSLWFLPTTGSPSQNKLSINSKLNSTSLRMVPLLSSATRDLNSDLSNSCSLELLTANKKIFGSKWTLLITLLKFLERMYKVDFVLWPSERTELTSSLWEILSSVDTMPCMMPLLKALLLLLLL